MPAPHPPEFRRRAVELARQGDRPIAVLAQRLQISESCLRRWVDQADIDDNGSDSRLTSAEKRELAQLRRQTRRLERENEILRHALAYFVRLLTHESSSALSCSGGPTAPNSAPSAQLAPRPVQYTACSAVSIG